MTWHKSLLSDNDPYVIAANALQSDLGEIDSHIRANREHKEMQSLVRNAWINPICIFFTCAPVSERVEYLGITLDKKRLGKEGTHVKAEHGPRSPQILKSEFSLKTRMFVDNVFRRSCEPTVFEFEEKLDLLEFAPFKPVATALPRLLAVSEIRDDSNLIRGSTVETMWIRTVNFTKPCSNRLVRRDYCLGNPICRLNGRRGLL